MEHPRDQGGLPSYHYLIRAALAVASAPSNLSYETRKRPEAFLENYEEAPDRQTA